MSNPNGNVKHGMHGTLTYWRWKSMIQRCYAVTGDNYRYYGGKGITVCDAWRSSFEAFLADMGECPGKEMTLDRIENNKGYEPGNCRWLTQADQNRNRTNAVLLTQGGITKSATEWAADTGLGLTTILARRRLGWTDERILGTPVVGRRRAGESKEAAAIRSGWLKAAAPDLLCALKACVNVLSSSSSESKDHATVLREALSAICKAERGATA